MIRGHVALARELAGWIGARDNYEVMAPVTFGLVCFRVPAGGEIKSELRHN